MRTVRASWMIATLFAAVACDDHKHARKPAEVPETTTATAEVAVAPDTASYEKYVERVTTEQLGGFPQIGWLVPPHFLLADGAPPDVVVLSSAGLARLSETTPLTRAEQDSIRKTHFVACGSDTAAMFETPFEVARAERVLVAMKPFRGDVVSGFEHPPLTPAQVAAGREMLSLGDSVNWRDSTFALTPTGSFYAVHAAYDKVSGDLVRSILYFVNASGVVVAREIRESKDYGSIPKYRAGLGQVYNVIQAFRLPGFPDPVLLVNTSSGDGRALSLFAATRSGKISEGRAHESVANCGHR